MLDILEAKFRWFGLGQRRNREHISRRTQRLELPGRRSGGRAQERFIDAVEVGVKEEHRRRGFRRKPVIG